MPQISKVMKFNTGDAVEVIVLKNFVWKVQVLLPDHQTLLIHPLCMDRGEKGRPEPGDRLVGVVTYAREVTTISTKRETLQEYRVVPLESYQGHLYRHELPVPEGLILPSNPSNYPIGELLTLQLTNYLLVGMVVKMSEGVYNLIHPDDYPRNDQGRHPSLKIGDFIQVVVLANRRDGVPHIGCLPEHFEAFGHSPFEFEYD